MVRRGVCAENNEILKGESARRNAEMESVDVMQNKQRPLHMTNLPVLLRCCRPVKWSPVQ